MAIEPSLLKESLELQPAKESDIAVLCPSSQPLKSNKTIVVDAVVWYNAARSVAGERLESELSQYIREVRNAD